MTTIAHDFEALPADLFVYLMRFLSGTDLLPLSHVSTRYHKELLGPNSNVWTTRAPFNFRHGPSTWRFFAKLGWYGLKKLRKRTAPPPPSSTRTFDMLTKAKRRYFGSVSMRFPGGIETPLTGQCSVGGVVAPCNVRLDIRWINASSFAFDVWFALLPPTSSIESDHALHPIGGVLLGAQSSHWCEFERPTEVAVARFVHIDPLGNLFCSVVSDESNEARQPIATLELERWYHLALTFDKSAASAEDSVDEGVQCVYLDGALVRSMYGRLPADLDQLKECQIGSGFMDVGCAGNIYPDYEGAYAFGGLVDEFRFWQGVLTQEDIQLLIRGHEGAVVKRETVKRTWSLMHDGQAFDFYGDLTAVHSTRPSEGLCLGVRLRYKVLTRDDPK